MAGAPGRTASLSVPRLACALLLSRPRSAGRPWHDRRWRAPAGTPAFYAVRARAAARRGCAGRSETALGAATTPPRAPGVTDGDWDAADERAVRESLEEKAGAGETVHVLGMTREELKAYAVETLQTQKFRGAQIADAAFRPGGAHSVGDIMQLPKQLRETAAERGLLIGRSKLHSTSLARDKTEKLLLQLHDGLVVETVGIPDRKRLTVCVSSQVGCPMRCTFCATGKGGFARNLQPHEIVDQVLAVQERFGDTRVSNIVFMGMGEPLLNLKSVVRAFHLINTEIGIGARHITISTVGVRNKIAALAAEQLQATLAVSLHAPNQALRKRLVPSAAAYPIDALLEDVAKYQEATGRRVSLEYALLGGVNDTLACAKELGETLRRAGLASAHINLIPWNPVDDADGLRRPSNADVSRFQQALEESHGVGKTSVRISRGLDAAAACGQLRNEMMRLKA